MWYVRHYRETAKGPEHSATASSRERCLSTMHVLEFSLLLWLRSLLIGVVGALTGLGGGVVLGPLLTLALQLLWRAI